MSITSTTTPAVTPAVTPVGPQEDLAGIVSDLDGTPAKPARIRIKRRRKVTLRMRVRDWMVTVKEELPWIAGMLVVFIAVFWGLLASEGGIREGIF